VRSPAPGHRVNVRSTPAFLRPVLGTALVAGSLVGGLTVVDALATDDPAPTVPTDAVTAAAADDARPAEEPSREPVVRHTHPATPEPEETEETEEPDEITAAAAAAPAPAPEPQPAFSIDWDVLAQCESHGEWDYGPHSGWGSGLFEGGLQFHPDTWDAYKPAGYPEAAYQASREQQILVAERVLAEQGLAAWPACTRELGWR
jgi:hypothetical protein